MTMYNLLVTNRDVPARMAGFLTEVFAVDRDRVFVGDDADRDSWDWDALRNSLVSCEYSRQEGDLAWALDIYAVDEVAGQPTEHELSLRLSTELQTVTLFPEGQTIPGMRQLTTPRGELMHARLEEPDEQGMVRRVDEVEAPVPELPHTTIARFPDIIKELKLPTPITDSLFPHAEDHRDPQWTHIHLVAWERLTVRMASNWPPSAWYPASMYVDDLRYRDELDQYIARLPKPQREAAEEARRRVDDRYRELTIDDDGASLIQADCASAEEIVQRPWYWRRRPDPVPWDEPGHSGS